MVVLEGIRKLVREPLHGIRELCKEAAEKTVLNLLSPALKAIPKALQGRVERGREIGATIADSLNKNKIENSRLFFNGESPSLLEFLFRRRPKVMQRVSPENINISGFSAKERQQLLDLLQGVDRISNPGGLPIFNVTKVVEKTPSSQLRPGVLGEFARFKDIAINRAAVPTARINSNLTDINRIKTQAHEIGGHGTESILSYPTVIPGGYNTNAIRQLNSIDPGATEFYAHHGGIRGLLGAREIARSRRDWGSVELYNTAIGEMRSEILNKALNKPDKGSYVIRGLRNQAASVKNSTKDRQGDIAEYLGMHSFFDDIVPGSTFGHLLQQPIRRLDNKVVQPTRIMEGGAPVMPEFNGVYDSFLSRLNRAGVAAFDDKKKPAGEPMMDWLARTKYI